ncbi:MAG: homoserine dehydrogenase, partial [Desulfovibrionaceae bacterium]|nr:homoserine dehydrogenase [Desulfovibrionaceae bacterium]
MTNDSTAPLVVGLAGCGTVGSGLLRVLAENGDLIRERTGRDIRIKSVLVRNPSRARAVPLPEGARLVTDAALLTDDPETDVVVELMGGIDAPRTLIDRALEHGKHIVTANKALLAEDGAGLFRKAAEKGLALLYEASVAGGIPIVQTLKESLAGNRIRSLVGILNGTSNYILSEMTSNGLDFETALAQAQEQGFAEADPTLDIDGHDAAHKLVLLIRLAYGVEYPYAELPIQGIRGLSELDINFAREFGYRIKLLGQVNEVDGRLEAGVFPTLVRHTFLLARVGGAYNAVRVDGRTHGGRITERRGR